MAAFLFAMSCGQVLAAGPAASEAIARGAEPPPPQAAQTGRFYSETGHTLAPEFVLFYDGHGVRLSWTRIQAAGKKLAEVRAFAAKDLQEECAAWLEHAWTLDEIQAVARGGNNASGWKRSWANSFDEERMPDIVLQAKPWKLIAMGAGTTHGTPYPYDQRVPLAFYGPGFEAKTVFGPASPVDALPTLMAALGLALPTGLDGRNLIER